MSALGSIGSVFTPTVNRDVGINQSTILKWTGYLLLAAIVFYFIFPKIQTFFSGWFVNVADVPYNMPGDGSVDTVAKRSYYEGLVQQMYLALTTSYTTGIQATPRCKAYERWVKELNNNEFRYCSNIFKKSYRKTVRQYVNETNWSGCGYAGTDYGVLFQRKLDGLSIP
jgi:L-lactate permease